MACLRGLGVGQVLRILRGKISSRPVCCCHLVAKEDKTRSFCPLGQSGVWLKVDGSSNPTANLLKQHCSVKEAASAGEEPPHAPQQLPFSAATCLLPSLLVRLCLFSFCTLPPPQPGSTKEGSQGLLALLCTVNCPKHLHVLTHLILIKAQLGRSHYPHFAGRETKAQRD